MLSDKNFINIATELATASKCVSKQVGAVIVKDGRILSTGYNGTPAGYTNCVDHWDDQYTSEHHEWSKTYEIHAEMNAIYNASLTGVSLRDSTLYVYGLPICNECAKGIIQCGIKKVVATRPTEYNGAWDKSIKGAEALFKEAEVIYLIDVEEE